MGILQFRSNPNLLKNWYFLNPVNQLEQSSMSAWSYGIDGWMASISADITSSGITFSSGVIAHPLENIVKPGISGKRLTGSVLLSDGTCHSGSAMYSGSSAVTFLADAYVQLRLTAEDYPIFTIQAQQSITVIAAKLEIGSRQTLAHEDGNSWVLNEIPDYGEQLLLCQRYLQRFRTAAERPTYAEDFRPVMRIDPVLWSETIGGVTYYLADARRGS